MRRFGSLMLALVLMLCLCACGKTAEPAPSAPAPAAEPTAAAVTPEPTAQPAESAPAEAPEQPLPEAAAGWQESYLTFLSDNYDIFAALWPEGLSGVGFIDLDLDGTPEMLVFDLGASATMGVQLFDLVDGQVYCISSVMDSATGAFDPTYFTPVSVCASYFESFRLIRNGDDLSFWVESANGTLESTWGEIIRFDCADGVLVPVSVCSRYLESNPETGVVFREEYTVGGEVSDEESYLRAAEPYTMGEDMGYDGSGLFLWNNMKHYDTTYEGFMAMAEDAATAHTPLALS